VEQKQQRIKDRQAKVNKEQEERVRQEEANQAPTDTEGLRIKQEALDKKKEDCEPRLKGRTRKEQTEYWSMIK
jgi:hypothetical protein